jgi:hypothetical protein
MQNVVLDSQLSLFIDYSCYNFYHAKILMFPFPLSHPSFRGQRQKCGWELKPQWVKSNNWTQDWGSQESEQIMEELMAKEAANMTEIGWSN